MIKPEAIIVHHEAGWAGLNGVNILHKQRFNFRSSLGWYVGYQWYIDTMGKYTQTRADTEEGVHTLGGWNQKAIGICLMGNYETAYPQQVQLDALDKLLGELQIKHDVPLEKIFYHGELWWTLCCGKNLKPWVVNYRKFDTTYLQTKVLQLTSLLNELLAKVAAKRNK